MICVLDLFRKSPRAQIGPDGTTPFTEKVKAVGAMALYQIRTFGAVAATKHDHCGHANTSCSRNFGTGVPRS